MTTFTASAIHDLRAMIARAVTDDPMRVVSVEVYTFDEDSRIGEIGTLEPRPSGGIAGGSWMRSDPDALAVLLAAEDFCLNHTGPVEWDEDDEWPSYDPENEARWKLGYLLAPEGDHASKDSFAAKLMLPRSNPNRN